MDFEKTRKEKPWNGPKVKNPNEGVPHTMQQVIGWLGWRRKGNRHVVVAETSEIDRRRKRKWLIWPHSDAFNPWTVNIGFMCFFFLHPIMENRFAHPLWHVDFPHQSVFKLKRYLFIFVQWDCTRHLSTFTKGAPTIVTKD